MKTEDHNPLLDDRLRSNFRPGVSFAEPAEPVRDPDTSVFIAPLRAGDVDPEELSDGHLPYLCLPEDRPEPVGDVGGLILIAVEGKDRQMAEVIARLLDPRNVVIGLMHVTWMPRTIDSPLAEGGLNNPGPGELLLYQGAREALVETGTKLREAGFDVSTHLREDRDPAVPLTRTILEQEPDLFVLGLGRHGAGIARRILAEARIPVLFVKAR